MSYGIRLLSLVVIASVLTGCQQTKDLSDLQAYMDGIKAKPKGQIEPLPKFRAYEAFTYSASGLRDPFQEPLKIEQSARKEQAVSNVRPDESRAKEFLEEFPIDTFTMVGSMSNEQGMWALLRGGEGIHRVYPGDYMGRNHGRIVGISESEISIIEIVPSGKDVWVERPRSITLKNDG